MEDDVRLSCDISAIEHAMLYLRVQKLRFDKKIFLRGLVAKGI